MFDWLRKRRARARAKAAGTPSADQLSELLRQARALAKQGYLDDASALLRSSDAPGHERVLALLLREYGRLDDAISVLQADTDPELVPMLEQFRRERGGQLSQLTLLRALDGRPPERTHEVDRLLEGGQIEEAIDLLKASHLPADRTRLQAVLRELGRTDELRDLANHSIRLATLRAEGRLDDLRSRADSGDREAANVLAEALAEKGGPTSVYDPYADEQDQVEDDEDATGPISTYADKKVFERLIEQGSVDEAAAALAGWPEWQVDDDARYGLVRLYVDQGRAEDAIAVLRTRRALAPDLLAKLLVETGRVSEAIAVLDTSKKPGAQRKAAQLRAEHGLLDELRARTDAGDRLSAEQLAIRLAVDAELDELRTRAAAGDSAFEAHLIGALGRLGHLDELATLATSNPAAGYMWWATLLAEADSHLVSDVLAEHAAHADWYAGERATAGIIDLLLEKRRIGTAIAFAEARVSAGDEWAAQWVPRPPQTRFPREKIDMWELLANGAVAAIQELLPTTSATEERSTTISIADADYGMYGDLRVSLPSPDRAEIALACWTVYTDTARYFGDHPPDEAERRLESDGTAIPELDLTVGVIDDLAHRLKTRTVPEPHPDGRHLTITIPLPMPMP